jgi:hypothetical protein
MWLLGKFCRRALAVSREYRPCALARLEQIAIFIAERNRDSARGLIDSKVKHGGGIPIGESCWFRSLYKAKGCWDDVDS